MKKEDNYLKLLDSIQRLEPHKVNKIWGGQKLAKLKGLSTEEPLGETWEVAAIKEGSSLIGTRKLSEYYDETSLPYLIKFIDTTDYLSVQVHPDDVYAQENEDSKGKTECWFILDSDPGACLYLGFKPGIDKEAFHKAIEDKEDLSSYLWKHEVSPGDFFYVPAGSIHAIGPGILLAEVQQACGVTYRVWDWNRLDSAGQSRELHIQQALDVLKFSSEDNTGDTFKLLHELFSNKGINEVVSHQDFQVKVVCGVEKVELKPAERPATIVCLKGGGTLNGSPVAEMETFLVPQGITAQYEQKDGSLCLVVS